jgi:hypothetical protein
VTKSRRENIIELHTLADGRKAIVCLYHGNDNLWWGAVSSGRRDVAVMAGKSWDGRPPKNEFEEMQWSMDPPYKVTDEKDDALRMAAALARLETWTDDKGRPYHAGSFDRRIASAAQYHLSDHPVIRRFSNICGRATLHCVINDRDPRICLEPLDTVAGFKAAERLYDRWPFLHNTFSAILLRHKDAVAAVMTDKALIDAAGHVETPITPVKIGDDREIDIVRSVIGAMGKAMRAEHIEDAAKAALSVFGILKFVHLDLGSPLSVTRLLKRWNGFPVFGENAAALLALAAAVPIDWLPRDSREAWGFEHAAGPIAELVVRSRGGLDARMLVSSAKGRWTDFHNRVAKSRQWTREVVDAARAFREQIVVPSVYHAAAFPEGDGAPDEVLRSATIHALPTDQVTELADSATWRILFGRKSLPTLMEAVRDWHRDMDAIETAIGRVPDAVWDAPFDRFDVDGISIAAIKDARTLRAEGRTMVHCVGGNSFVRDCVNREAVIVSLRRSKDGIFEPLSTAELTSWEPNKPWRPQVVQHRGPRNKPPSDEAAAALHAMTKAFGSGEYIAPAPSALPPELDLDPVTASAGYDWMDADKVSNAIRQWAHFLPREVVTGGLSWFAANLQDILGKQTKKIADDRKQACSP